MKQVGLLVLMLCCSFSLYSQGPMGARGRGGMRGDRSQMMKNAGNTSVSDELFVMNIPNLPDINPNQKMQLAKLLVSEKKEINKLMAEKENIQNQERQSLQKAKTGDKNHEKYMKKYAEEDKKIEGVGNKYNIKYKNLLTAEQYSVFQQKKSEIQFKNLSRVGGQSFDFTKGSNSEISPEGHRLEGEDSF